MPSATPGEAGRPLSSAVAVWAGRVNLSGKPQSPRYGKSSPAWVAVPTPAGGRTPEARSPPVVHDALLEEPVADADQHHAEPGVGALIDVEVVVGRERRHVGGQ